MSRARHPAPEATTAAPSLSLRLDLGGGLRIGPGKVVLLEEIGRSGSISGAGRALKMSYRRAWELVEDLNRGMGTAVVEAVAGGAGGGGARLTATGEAIIAHYRRIEAHARQVAAEPLAELARCRTDSAAVQEPAGASEPPPE
jgi:molybdate transport system regulatory protein